MEMRSPSPWGRLGARLLARSGRAKQASAVLACLAACHGAIGGDEAPEARPSTPAPGTSAAPPSSRSGGSQPPSAAAPSGGSTAGPAVAGPPGFTPISLLTPGELQNTLRDLFGDRGITLDTGTVQSTRYDTDAETFAIASPQIDQFLATAQRLADAADPQKLSPCDVAAKTEPVCAKQFIQTFGKRALRRPLDADEITDYVALYTEMRKSDDHATSLRTALAWMLMSPAFLYHFDRGGAEPGDGSSRPLTPYELASRLSYLLWQSMPDDALFAAADAGRLSTKEQILEQAKRMLGDARAKETFWSWTGQWLGLATLDSVQKDAAAYPGYAAAKPELLPSLRRFTEEVMWQGDGTLKSFLTAPFTFTGAKMAPLYGFAAPPTGFAKVPTDPAQRVGLLTQPALLAMLGKADKSAPILRGVFVRQRLLCSDLPPPPPGASMIPPGTPETKTTREYFTNLTSPMTCSACHAQINPIGFAYEHFDGVGRWRESENGAPIDANGELSVSDVAGKFDGAVALAKRLAGSRDVELCLARQWFRFGFRRYETGADEAFIVALAEALRAGGSSLTALPVALTQLDGFSRLHFTTKELRK